MIGESATRPGILWRMPLVEQAAAIEFWSSNETTPIVSWLNLLILKRDLEVEMSLKDSLLLLDAFDGK